MDDDLFDDPARRRWWLLNMALDGASLVEALRLASAVEAFLGTPGNTDVIGAPGAACRAPRIAARQPDADKVAIPANLPPLNEGRTPNPRFGDTDRTAAMSGANDEVPEQEADSDATVSQLAVLAFPDEVLRFLQQGGDAVVSDGDAYLVNGSSRETLALLTERANRIRAGRGLPAFQVVPMGWAPVAIKGRASV